MLFQKRVDRALDYLHEQNEGTEKAMERGENDEPAPMRDAVEKGDIKAMIMAAMVTLWLPASVVLGLICLVVMLIFS